MGRIIVLGMILVVVVFSSCFRLTEPEEAMECPIPLDYGDSYIYGDSVNCLSGVEYNSQVFIFPESFCWPQFGQKMKVGLSESIKVNENEVTGKIVEEEVLAGIFVFKRKFLYVWDEPTLKIYIFTKDSTLQKYIAFNCYNQVSFKFGQHTTTLLKTGSYGIYKRCYFFQVDNYQKRVVIYPEVGFLTYLCHPAGLVLDFRSWDLKNRTYWPPWP